MSFPSNYNFSYYVGDTIHFVVAPKTRGGQPMDLSGYTASLVISNEKSPNPDWSVDATVEVNATDGYITCYVFPDVGNQLSTSSRYYYDLEIRKSVEGKEYVYTLLRGEIKPEMGVNRHV